MASVFSDFLEVWDIFGSIPECHLEVMVHAPSGMSICKVTHVILALDDHLELYQAVMFLHKSALHVVSIWGLFVGLCSQDRIAQVASASCGVRVIVASGITAASATSVTCPVLFKQSDLDVLLWLKNQDIMGMSVGLLHLRTMSGGGADASETYGASVHPHLCVVTTIGALCPAYRCYILVPDTLVMKPAGERGVCFRAHHPSLVCEQSLEGHSAWMVGPCVFYLVVKMAATTQTVVVCKFAAAPGVIRY